MIYKHVPGKVMYSDHINLFIKGKLTVFIPFIQTLSSSVRSLRRVTFKNLWHKLPTQFCCYNYYVTLFHRKEDNSFHTLSLRHSIVEGTRFVKEIDLILYKHF